MRWFGASRKKESWVAMSLDGDSLALVHSESDPKRPTVLQQALVPLDPVEGLPLQRLAKNKAYKKQSFAMLLKPGEYQVLLVEAPKVAAEEVKQSICWSIKDLLDHPIEDVSFDVLDIPVIKDDPLANHQMYVVAAPSMLVKERVTQFDRAKLSLEAIDVPETAQRNIATLYEEPHHSVAFVHIDDDGALLTVSFAGELYYTRRIDVTFGALVSGLPHDRTASEERLVSELQRSLDHFERQFALIPISKVVLGPMREDNEIDKLLAEGLGISIEACDLREVMEFVDKTIGPAGQSRIFYPLGAAMRTTAAVN